MGGDILAQEMIDAIKSAEQKAEDIERAAEAAGEAMINEAKEKAIQICLTMTKDAKTAAAAVKTDAEAKSKKKLKTAADEAEHELVTLRSAARAKEADAIKLVLSELI